MFTVVHDLREIRRPASTDAALARSGERRDGRNRHAGPTRRLHCAGRAGLADRCPGMLLVSAGLGDSAGLGGAGRSGPALIAHVHAGSLGWLTLAALAVAVRMADDGGQTEPRLASGRFGIYVSCVTVVAVAGFVAAAAAGSAAAEAWTGTAALLAILGFMAWLVVLSRATRIRWGAPQVGMAGALVVLVAGAILGAISAGDTASGNATGAASLGSAHSAVLVVPFVLLAATAVVEWAAGRPSSDYEPVTTAGLVQVGALLVAAAVIIAGVPGTDIALVEANIPLELGGIAIFLIRVGPLLLTAGWAKGSRIWLVTSTVALSVDAGLFAHVVFEIGARRVDRPSAAVAAVHRRPRHVRRGRDNGLVRRHRGYGRRCGRRRAATSRPTGCSGPGGWAGGDGGWHRRWLGGHRGRVRRGARHRAAGCGRGCWPPGRDGHPRCRRSPADKVTASRVLNALLVAAVVASRQAVRSTGGRSRQDRTARVR